MGTDPADPVKAPEIPDEIRDWAEVIVHLGTGIAHARATKPGTAYDRAREHIEEAKALLVAYLRGSGA